MRNGLLLVKTRWNIKLFKQVQQPQNGEID